jgi:hypothetical protein
MPIGVDVSVNESVGFDVIMLYWCVSVTDLWCMVAVVGYTHECGC